MKTWSLFENVPEWIWGLLLAMGLVLFSYVLFQNTSARPYKLPAKEKPVVYVTGHPNYEDNLDGKIVYALEYAIDGVSQIPVNFYTEKERIEYEGWLYEMCRRAK